MDGYRTLGFIIIVLLGLFFYFIPTLIQQTRGARYGGWIFLINLLFGWTGLGWLAAVIWAVVEQPVADKDRRELHMMMDGEALADKNREWTVGDPAPGAKNEF